MHSFMAANFGEHLLCEARPTQSPNQVTHGQHMLRYPRPENPKGHLNLARASRMRHARAFPVRVTFRESMRPVSLINMPFTILGTHAPTRAPESLTLKASLSGRLHKDSVICNCLHVAIPSQHRGLHPSVLDKLKVKVVFDHG